MKKLFAILDRVQDAWPAGAGFLLMATTPPAWSLDAAYRVVAGWSIQEYHSYRRQLPVLVANLQALHRSWCVAAALAVVLAALIVAAGMPVAAISDPAGGVLAGVLAAVLLPPLAICNGIMRDYVAAQALLLACSRASVTEV
jgi:hypothetical protein